VILAVLLCFVNRFHVGTIPEPSAIEKRPRLKKGMAGPLVCGKIKNLSFS